MLQTTVQVVVNIAVNVHQSDPMDPASTFGTLNETIPTQTVTCGTAGTFTVSERHFTSHPTPGCLGTAFIAATTTAPAQKKALVISTVTQVSPEPTSFPGVVQPGTVNFSFVDNGNPPQPPDQLQGPPEPDVVSFACPATVADASAAAAATSPDNTLTNGHISVRNATTP